MSTVRNTRLTLLSFVALGLCGLALFLLPIVSPAAPTISWNPKSVSEIVAQGEIINIPVSFRAGKTLTNVTFRVVPEISPYVSVTPVSLDSIAKDETVVVTLSFSPAEDAPVDTFDGTVHVRAGTSARTYAQPLPVTVTILEKLPGSVEPDPAMVVSDPEGGIYPVNQVLITLVEGATRSDAEDLADSVDGTLVGFVESINTYQLEVPTTTIAELTLLIDALKGAPTVALVGTNNLYVPDAAPSTDLGNLRDADASLTAAYDQINIHKAWELVANTLTVATRRVIVGISDTGIMGAHPEFDFV